MAVERIKSETTLEPARWMGLSSDTKPTTGVDTGDTFIELNTLAEWIYSKDNVNASTGNGWWPLQSETE